MVSSGGGGGAAAQGAKGPGGPMSQSLKKGPWTAAEDAILMEYVKTYGEGNWNAVQKNSGLLRCGKSCRLRWANHLRPNLKKGSFSAEEERIIIELHAKIGNKWARMASQLPGRTDNEIKNYWNTRMKRRQRAGLAIYPQEVQEKAAVFHLQHQVQHHPHHHYQKRPHNNSSPSLSSLLTSQKAAYNPLFNTFNFSSPQNRHLQNQVNSYYSNPNSQFKLFCNTNNMNTGFSLPLSSSASPYPPSSAGLFNQNIQTQAITFPNFKFDSENFERDMSFSSMIASIDPIDFLPGQEVELPSSLTPPQPTTPSSGSSGGVCVMVASGNITNNNNVDYTTAPPKTASTTSNSGLLDALVQESHNLSAAARGADAEKGKSAAYHPSSEEGGDVSMMKNGGDANAVNKCEDLSSSQSSIGMKQSEEPLEEMNSMDDDLMSLLNDFPMPMPLPEWYSAGSSNISNASSSSINDQPNVPPTPPPPPPPSVASPWNEFDSCSRDNIPEFG